MIVRISKTYVGWVFAVALFATTASIAQQNPPEQMGSSKPQAQTPLMKLEGLKTDASAPLIITLQDAQGRARKNDPQFNAALGEAKSAGEDRTQARASLLPQVSSTLQYLGTQGNGTLPSGRYVSNDGVHLYRAWGVFHQDLSPANLTMTPQKRAAAAEAIAKAKAEIAKRGLVVTVTKSYYDLAVAQRKYATAQQSIESSRRFLSITQSLEQQGQIAHSDEVKADLQYQQQLQAFDEAGLALETSRLNLSVLLFPSLNENYNIVDDLDAPSALPQFAEAQEMAQRENPEMREAMEALHASDLDVTSAKLAFLPSLTVDTDYGIEANRFALKSHVAGNMDAGRLPNLGYFVTATLNIPVWDWGTLRSKLRQSEIKKQQTEVEVSFAQRQMVSNLYAYYNEATVSHKSVGTLRHVADLAAESLRLITLRYQAGESTAMEVVDAQNTLTQARNAYDEAQARYRSAVATLQTVTGSF